MVPNHQADPYTCRWCGHHEPVPSLTADHEARCIARPTEKAA